MIDRILKKTFRQTIDRVKKGRPEMPLELWSEAVFRFIFCQSLKKSKDRIRPFVEVNRIDLLLHHKKKRAVLEFKFYQRCKRYDLAGNPKGFKGGPSAKNCEEFRESVRKLRRCAPSDVLKLVVLFYADPIKPSRKTFEACYGRGSGIEARLGLRHLDTMGPFDLPDGSRCTARLFQVNPRPRN